MLTGRIVPAEHPPASPQQLLLVFGAGLDLVAFAWLMSIELELLAAVVLGSGLTVGLVLAIRAYRRVDGADEKTIARSWTAEELRVLRTAAPAPAAKPTPYPRRPVESPARVEPGDELVRIKFAVLRQRFARETTALLDGMTAFMQEPPRGAM